MAANTSSQSATAEARAETHCPVEATLALIGGKYKSLIVWKLMGGSLRFSHLRAAVPGATPRMLTRQLRELEESGLVHREVFPVVRVGERLPAQARAGSQLLNATPAVRRRNAGSRPPSRRRVSP